MSLHILRFFARKTLKASPLSNRKSERLAAQDTLGESTLKECPILRLMILKGDAFSINTACCSHSENNLAFNTMGILISQLYENIDVFNIYGDYASALLIREFGIRNSISLFHEVIIRNDAESVTSQ